MIDVPVGVLRELAERFSFDPSSLQKIGGGREDSDGVVYRAGDRVLKIIAKNADDPSARFATMERARFFAYLGERGVPVVSPVPNAGGNLVEGLAEGKHLFLAYSYPYLPGVTLKPEKWSEEVLENWGALIGQTHRLTQDYPVFDGIIDPVTGKTALNWRDEMDSFQNWCDDEDVKDVWRSLKNRAEALPATRGTCGMIQNDPHMENVLIHENKLHLIDFDVSLCHFFTCDIAIAIQSVLFTQSGGMERPVRDVSALRRFVAHLLKGYRRACDLPRASLSAIELFIAYRRALLFTVMQDWLKTQPKMYDSWKQMTVGQPPVIGLIEKDL